MTTQEGVKDKDGCREKDHEIHVSRDEDIKDLARGNHLTRNDTQPSDGDNDRAHQFHAGAVLIPQEFRQGIKRISPNPFGQ